VTERVYECDVAVIGGGMGGVAAALAAAQLGMRVLLSEETDWLGGQISSQGVSALDEHAYIESFGGTRTYYALREGIRDDYRARYAVPAAMPDGAPLNPGNGWVSRLCFEPRVGVRVIDAMLAPQIEARRLRVLIETRPVAAVVQDDRVIQVTLRSRHDQEVQVRAVYVLDATELGELLPLTGTDFVTGAEAGAETGEPHASADGPHPGEVQSFTYCFAVEYCPGQDHTIRKPRGYAGFRERQPYSLTLEAQDGTPRPFRMFEESPEGLLPFWTYRRIREGTLLDRSGELGDIALINWHGNDYHGASLIGKTPGEWARVVDEAKRLALGFLFWLQTEAQRDDGASYGYPGLRLLPDVMDTGDGLSKAPYFRESRRIVPLKRIVEGDVLAAGRKGARAAPFPDAVGIGWYALDLHPAVGNTRTLFEPTLPFQIPLGALIPRDGPGNLMAACKNIGTTHISNGAYRLHPVEWNIGESAGALAAFCCQEGCTPRHVFENRPLLLRFQYRLLQRGVPLAWTIDVPAAHELFLPVQMLAVAGAIAPESERFHSLQVQLDEALSYRDAAGLFGAAFRLLGRPVPRDWREKWSVQPDAPIPHADVVKMLQAADVTTAPLGDPPTWGALCRALAPHIAHAFAAPDA
jgi:hypothetical protein